MADRKKLKKLHVPNNERLPKLYKNVEKILRKVKVCESSVKTELYNSRHRGNHFQRVYALTMEVLKHRNLLEKIIEKTALLQKEPFFKKDVAEILIYELILGTKFLPIKGKQILTIMKYKEDIVNAYEDIKCNLDQSELLGIPRLPRYARVHTLFTTLSHVLQELKDEGYEQIHYSEDTKEKKYLTLVQELDTKKFLIDYHFKDLLVFAHGENLTHLPLYENKHIYLQDKSSNIPVHALNPHPGSFVFDACAAPGMKSVHLAAKMENKGVLHACEWKKDRFETLLNMLQDGGVKISKAVCKDFRSIDPLDELYSSVEYILVDPTCSGSGMVTRMDAVTDTAESKNKDRLHRLAGFQIVLLKHALKFPSVRKVVYSTCSISEEENEFVVQEALNCFQKDFQLVPVMPSWPVRGSENYECGSYCLRAYPEKNLTNGFFVAIFERIQNLNYTSNLCYVNSEDISYNLTETYSEFSIKKEKMKRNKFKVERNDIDHGTPVVFPKNVQIEASHNVSSVHIGINNDMQYGEEHKNILNYNSDVTHEKHKHKKKKKSRYDKFSDSKINEVSDNSELLNLETLESYPDPNFSAESSSFCNQKKKRKNKTYYKKDDDKCQDFLSTSDTNFIKGSQTDNSTEMAADGVHEVISLRYLKDHSEHGEYVKRKKHKKKLNEKNEMPAANDSTVVSPKGVTIKEIDSIQSGQIAEQQMKQPNLTFDITVLRTKMKIKGKFQNIDAVDCQVFNQVTIDHFAEQNLLESVENAAKDVQESQQ